MSTGGVILTRENQHTWRKTCLSATLSTTNPTWTGLASNSSFCSERPVTNCPRHDMPCTVICVLERTRLTYKVSLSDLHLQVDTSLCSSMTADEVRALVKEWVSCEDMPQSCDVRMLADYLERQIASRNIDDMYIVVKCLYRSVSNYILKLKYNIILDYTQCLLRAASTVAPHITKCSISVHSLPALLDTLLSQFILNTINTHSRIN
jgi:hypothetical protein